MENGNLNFDKNLINPVTGKPIETYYGVKDTWNTVFKELSTTYEV